jgi:hypothetical protein
MTTIDQNATASAATPELPAALTVASVPALPAWLVAARAAVAAAAADSLAIPESALETTWLYREVDTGDGVRYGLYRGAETIEAASAELEAALAGAPARTPAASRIAPTTIARWALQGRLAALDDSFLDRIPREGEWPARLVLGHTIEGQRSYGWFSRWWLSQPLGPDRPSRVTDEAEQAGTAAMPSEDEERAGTLAELRSRLDDVVDEWSLRYASLDASALAVPARWAGVPVDIDFRLGRWASHIAEHTIQLDKTLTWLGYEPSEPARIVRELLTAWGRLESRIFPVVPAGTDAAVASILDRMANTLVTEARSVRAAAGV